MEEQNKVLLCQDIMNAVFRGTALLKTFDRFQLDAKEMQDRNITRDYVKGIIEGAEDIDVLHITADNAKGLVNLARSYTLNHPDQNFNNVFNNNLKDMISSYTDADDNTSIPMHRRNYIDVMKEYTDIVPGKSEFLLLLSRIERELESPKTDIKLEERWGTNIHYPFGRDNEKLTKPIINKTHNNLFKRFLEVLEKHTSDGDEVKKQYEYFKEQIETNKKAVDKLFSDNTLKSAIRENFIELYGKIAQYAEENDLLNEIKISPKAGGLNL